MATFKMKIKNELDINEKPRVYFTCHPDDFDRCFEKVCNDIFKTHDCAIYYTEDMTEVISDDEKEPDLGRMNLFVIPVTFRLLFNPNRAMDDDIAYAKKEQIPILPIMMESGIDMFYSKPDKFGELQYLNPYSRDLTEISYEEKLKKYLELVLISNEMTERIREAFNSYIFLSYRKKDRKYANQLMRIIHSNPQCRDIAIWFDEFLTPGESFRDNISKILKKSQLFTLLVTPNLLEEVDGKPNFIMSEEYPAACELGMKIFPTEMEDTDKVLLSEKFEGLPVCVRVDEDNFKSQFIEATTIVASEENNTPEHNFLIGLAYLDGIDVETNRKFGLELITEAADAGLVEAMEKLYSFYNETVIDYNEVLKWADKIYNFYCENFGEEYPDTLIALNNLSYSYLNVGNYKKALELGERVYNLRSRILGEENSDTLRALNNLAGIYSDVGDYKKSLEIFEKVYALRSRIFGEECMDTLVALNNLACSYLDVGNYEKALELSERVYNLRSRILGEEHHDTLIALNNLIVIYLEVGNYNKALELSKLGYALCSRILGEEHPDTLTSLNNLASAYGKVGDYKKSLELNERAYVLRSKILGEEHPDTLTSLNNLASAYGRVGDDEKSLELTKNGYALSCKIFGEEHPDTLWSLNNLASAYGKVDDYDKKIELNKKVYALCCKIFGKEHPHTLISLSNLACGYYIIGDLKKSVDLYEKLYVLRSKILGEEHSDTLMALNNLARIYYESDDLEMALVVFDKLYVILKRLFGADHPETLEILGILKFIKSKNRK